jgi:hypothetical protein
VSHSPAKKAPSKGNKQKEAFKNSARAAVAKK